VDGLRDSEAIDEERNMSTAGHRPHPPARRGPGAASVVFAWGSKIKAHGWTSRPVAQSDHQYKGTDKTMVGEVVAKA
jgi:hypothetical protein